MGYGTSESREQFYNIFLDKEEIKNTELGKLINEKKGESGFLKFVKNLQRLL